MEETQTTTRERLWSQSVANKGFVKQQGGQPNKKLCHTWEKPIMEKRHVAVAEPVLLISETKLNDSTM